MYKAIIVDDEKMIRLGIKTMIPWKSIGIEKVFVASSGREAFEIIQIEKPDIMITDISMTEISGLELIERVNQLNYSTKILVLTGYDSFEYAQKCLRMQVEDFFLKPIDETVLTQALKKIMNKIRDEENALKSECIIRRTQGTYEQMRLEKIMRDLVKNKINLSEELRNLQEEFQIELNSNLQVAIIVPTLYMGTERNGENFMALSIKNICISLFDAKGEGITFIDDEGKIVIAFIENNAFEGTYKRVENLNSILKDEYNFIPKIVLGSQIQGFLNLHISYNDAAYLLKSEKKYIREIIQNYNSESKFNLFNTVFSEIKNIMITNTGNLDCILKAFKTFVRATESYNLSNDYVNRCCFDMAATLYYSFVNDSGKAIDSKLNSLMTSLLHSTREEACEFTEDFISQMFNKDNDVHEIISTAKNIINEDLARDLSVASIAEQMYITPNYFSRLFKKETGEGCNEYIVRQRIEKAKSLLETTNIKTGKIATIVGYNDTNYFSLAFKKYTGMSPTKYRERLRE